MKKFSIIGGLMTISLLLSGCNEMDQFPHNGVSSDNLTEEDAQLLLTGLYFYAEAKPTVDGYLTQDILGGELVRGGATGMTDPVILVRDLVTPESGFISNPYNGYFTGLYQMNSLIRSLRKMEPTESRNEMLGTACFLRGLFYYNLVSRYGEVPILDEPYDGDIAASTEEEGWAFVEENFQTAINYCPAFYDKNFVSRQAAKALMARTKLAMGKKAEAAALAEELINDGNFALDDFEKIFRNKANREEIFTFSNLLTESGLKISASLYTRAATNGGSGTYAPTAEVMNLFSDDDKRKAMSIDRQEANNVINKYPGGEVDSDPIIITRLAEMYLISAEGQGVPNGLKRLNELRAMRGLNPVSASTEEELLTLVLAERRMELLAEGFRWFDLVRTGRLESTLGFDRKYNRLPIPSREMSLNKLLKQNSYWAAQN